MGLVTWWRQRGKREPGPPAVALPQQPRDPRVFSVTIGYSACLEVAGTTTFAKEAVEGLAAREGLGDGATTRELPNFSATRRTRSTRTPLLSS